MNKPEVIAKLTELGVAHDPAANKADLEALLPVEPAATADASAPAPAPAPAPEGDQAVEQHDGIEVGDPQSLRPVELPLVVKPSNGGKWKNDAQTEYASYLNAYAYKNPTKWGKKKATLIKNLQEIGDNPEAIIRFRGNQGNLAYNNKLIAAPEVAE